MKQAAEQMWFIGYSFYGNMCKDHRVIATQDEDEAVYQFWEWMNTYYPDEIHAVKLYHMRRVGEFDNDVSVE